MPDLTPDGRLPLLLLPVRLETRFDPGNAALRVRVYPDDVHVDAHDPRLSDAEVEDGRRYHELVATGQATEAQAWAVLARRYSPGRARWVARATAGGAEPDRRDDGDALPAEARLLPDRWVAAVRWRDRSGAEHETVELFGEPVRAPLPLSPSKADGTAMDDLWTPGSPSGGVRWMLDFDEAVRAGMAGRIDLGRPAASVDRLVVFGVRGSERGDVDAAEAVRELVEAHAYGEGFAFVPQGTPAHHARGERSGHDPEAPGPPPSTRRPLSDGTNGAVLARALGLDTDDVLRDAPHAGDPEQADARVMNAALWTPTWGAYLRQHMSPQVGGSERMPEARRHFEDHVRGRGPLPAVRVRRQPYGVLPATSLDLWEADGELERAVRDLLVALLPSWTGPAEDETDAAVPRLDRIEDGARVEDQIAEIVRVLGVGPHPETVGARLAVPLEDAPGLRSGLEASLRRLGIPDEDARLAGTAYQPGEPFPVVPPLPLVAYPPGRQRPEPLPLVPEAETYDGLITEALPSALHAALPGLRPDEREETLAVFLPGQFGRSHRHDRLRWLDRTLEERRERVHGDLSWFAEAPYPLLYTLLWRGAILQYVEVAADGLRRAGVDLDVPYREPADPASGPTPTALIDRFVGKVLAPELDVPPEEARQALSRELPFLGQVELSVEVVDGFRSFWKAVDAVRAIGERPGGVTALELLLRETLSLASHRLDAWATSLAARRLEALRETEPRGLRVGGYGWVEGIVPGGAPASEGYVHAPSAGQATTAAVLHTGHLSHRAAAPPGESPFAVDLSSDRVRAGLGLLEGVRGGLSLGELLGYRLERALHEGHPGLELDALVLRLRQAFPLAAGKRAEPGGDGAADVLGPVHVVDGLAVLRAHKGQSPASLSDVLDVALNGRPQDEQDAARGAVEAEVEALDDAVDAVSDLAVAEGVHQLVMGNPTRAGAALDALGRGEAPPPEFDVVRTPRSGRALTHRVAVVDGRGPAALPPARTPRAAAEPAVNAWARHLLGDLDRARCVVRTTAGGDGAATEHDVRLGALGLDPIDVVLLGAEGAAQQTELDVRVAAHVLSGAADPAAVVEVDYSPPAGPAGTVPATAVLQAAAALRRVVTGARPLHAGDLALPEGRAEGEPLGRDDADLDARAQTARCAFATAFEALRRATVLPTVPDPGVPLLDPAPLQSLLAACGAGPSVAHSLADAEGADLGAPAADVALDLEAVRSALFEVALLGVQGAAPQTVAGDGPEVRAALVAQVASVGRELHGRAAALDALAADAASDPLLPLEVVFGRGFPVVPRFAPPASAAGVFEASDRLQQGDPFASAEWAHGVAPVRPRTAALVDALVDAEGLAGEPRLALEVGQLPDGPRADGSDRVWAALPDGKDDGRLSLVAWTPGGAPGGAPTLAGLVVDEWTETVPDAGESTGLAFQYDAPGARPPQSLLLAVPPQLGAPWTTESLRRVLDETLDLAKARAVDLDGVRAVGHFLPAIHV